MQTITRADFNAAVWTDRAFRGRWSYMEPVCDRLRHLDGPVLELGPYKMPICPDCHTMDYRAYGDCKPTFLWDAKRTPWPIPDKAYGVFIALQVWEHLEGKQSEAWKEVCRIARHAIISVPWKWTRSKTANHTGIDRERVREWTNNAKPVWTKLAQPGSRRIFQFDLT